VDKSLALLRLGKKWLDRLIGGLVEAGRTISYVETNNPSQSDSLHKSIKLSDMGTFKRAFEQGVRRALRAMRFGPVKVALDVTEDPYWGSGGEFNTRPPVHKDTEQSWQYLTLSIVEPKFFPLMSMPYRQVDDLDDLVIDLLEYLRSLPLRVKLVLFDRGFYHAHLIDYLENRRGGRPWPYLIFVPKNKAMQRYLNATDKLGEYKHEMNHKRKHTLWKPTTKIVICKGVGKTKEGKPIDWCFATNQTGSLSLVWEYRKRWNIETGFRIHDEARIKTKSNHPLIRYFYHLFGMLLVLAWRVQNHTHTYYLTFKRYLKLVEQSFPVVMKPPPSTLIT